MPRRDQITRQARIDAVRREATAPDIIHVRTTRLVHVPNTTGEPCPCCRNRFALVAQEVPGWELAIDTTTRERWLRAHHDLPRWAYDRGRRTSVIHPTDFDALVEDAEMVDSPIRCTEKTLPILLDHDTAIRGATGGARSMKTQTGTLWMFLEWMLRGGPGTLGWFLGPELKHAWILVDKWLHGEGETNPAVCDRRLVLEEPAKAAKYAEDPFLRMIDGTKIAIKHMKGDGSNLSGRGIEFWQATEIAAVRDQKNWARARGRLVSSGGHAYYDRVPEPVHWSKEATVRRSEREDVEELDAARKGERYSRTIRNHHLSSDDNPWNDPVETRSFIRELELIDPRLADREGRGLEVGDANVLFDDVWDASRHTFSTEGWDTSDVRRQWRDVTRQVSRKWFRREHDWLIGCDVNKNPVTLAPCKIFVEGDKDQVDERDSVHWRAAFFDAIQVWGEGPREAAKKTRRVHGGIFGGAGVVMDATACLRRHDRQLDRGSMLAKEYFEEEGFEVRGPDRWPDSGKWRNPSRVDRTLMQRRLMSEDRIYVNRLRGAPLIEAYETQVAMKDGLTPAKASNTWGDRHIACLVESSAYVLWPFFSKTRSTVGPIKVREYG